MHACMVKRLRVERTIIITPTPGVLTVSVTGPTHGYVGRMQTFTAVWESIYYPWTVVWDWGDGTPKETYTAPEAPEDIRSHYYNIPGTFTVTVTVTSNATKISETGSGTATITIAVGLSATLTADKTSGPVPLAVIFTCGASGGFLNYTWTLDPGDGLAPYSGTRTVGGSWNQAHTYMQAGAFTAKLTVTDALGASLFTEAKVYAGVTPPTLIGIIAPLALGSILIIASILKR